MNHNNLYLSIGSAVGSFLSGLVATATQYNMMWCISFLAAVVSIAAGITTIREKRMSIKMMRERNKLNGGS